MPARDVTAAEICRLCSLETGGCCRCPEPETPGFPLSPAELERLMAHAHLADSTEDADSPLERVSMPAPNSLEFLAAMEALLPRHKKAIAALFPSGGTYRKPKLRPSGDCVFRSNKGCRLPRKARPWYCNLFPLWMRGEGVMLMNPEGCRLREATASPAEAMRLMGTCAPDVRLQFADLLRDWNWNP